MNKKRKTIFRNNNVLLQQVIEYNNNDRVGTYELRMTHNNDSKFSEFIDAITNLDKERTIILRDALTCIIENDFHVVKPIKMHKRNKKNRFADIELI